jgi:hypothetical protein
MSVNSTSRVYLQNERRYNYTTPKSFLEQISLYSKLLRQKSSELTGKVARLENGLDKLRSTAEQVKCNHLIFSGIWWKIQLLYFLNYFFIPNNFQTNGSFQMHHISFTDIMQLVMVGARVPVSSDNQTNPTCTLCVQNGVLFQFKGSATHNHYCLYISNFYIHFISLHVTFFWRLCCLLFTLEWKRKSFKIAMLYMHICAYACHNRTDMLYCEVTTSVPLI